ncbi:hypothetical protein CVIRNUC_011027 [Coccomyxa viridis]|uniref:Serine aminopeptidase S33 domain-containing protein n=1 Tax=Coccomyxa viridis TaxID=1274662 RepID=A0AAV1INV4_9CHLO|nr:hypothetical protein CVIRNUC_011027 [Coccomyxa viridis]
MSLFGGVWDQLVDCICRPPRDSYTTSQLPGGEDGRFAVSGVVCSREDITLMNDKGKLKLECSLFTPETVARCTGGGNPLVVYCHCNSGSRRDAEEALHVLMPHGIMVFALDFAGSGKSGGEYVTLGAHEVDDLGVAVAHLRGRFSSCTIGLWGRSMGAVTALLYSQRDPSIAGIVLDSPFGRLKDLMVELCEEQKLPIPRAFMRIALSMMRRSVRKRANFNVDDVSPLDVVPGSFIPALFGHAEQDTFVSKAHSERLHKAYAGDKNLITFEGDHNSHRPQFFYSSVLIFLSTVLQLDEPMPEHEAEETAAMAGRLPAAADASAEKEALMVERTLSVPWITGPGWGGSPEDLELAWAAEMSRGIYQGDVRLAEVEPGTSRSAGDGQPRSLSDPQEHRASSARGGGAAAQRDARSASVAGEAPADKDQTEEEQREADEAAAVLRAEREARRAEEAASQRERWRLMQDDEDELLAEALNLSLEQEQQQTGQPVASRARRRPPGSTRSREEYMPKALAAMSEEDADEAMLVQAIQASLIDAGEGHDAQPASAGTGSSSKKQPADGPDPKIKSRVPKLANGNTHLDNGSHAVRSSNDSFSVTPLLAKGDAAQRGGLLDTQIHPERGALSHSLDSEGEASAGGGEHAAPMAALKRSNEDEMEDMFKRAADAAARGDYSAAAAGRFSED